MFVVNDQVQMQHLPVMLDEVVTALAPQEHSVIIDATFGAGGYTKAILNKNVATVIGIDRDPAAIAAGQAMVAAAEGRLRLVEGQFSEIAALALAQGFSEVEGVVLDIGVSSMQLDQAGRGFSFQRNGPLDMRMSQAGLSAADVVNKASAELLANIFFLYGEETRSRAIARAILAQRALKPIETTFELVSVIEQAIGPQRAKDRIHPATRSFQALRIYINGELDELVSALHGAEKILKPGGRLVVVTFHSLEDRIVKRFLASRTTTAHETTRYQPQPTDMPNPSFTLTQRGVVVATTAEIAANPRARSAKLRMAVRSAAPAHKMTVKGLGVPTVERKAQ